MIIVCNRLRYDLLEKYGDRKKPGRFSLLINHKNKLPYIVPKNVEHINYAKEILQTEELENIYPFPLVPSHIHFTCEKNKEEITGIITGVSGLEQSLGKIHSHQSLKNAHDIVWKLIINSKISLNILENTIIFDYAR